MRDAFLKVADSIQNQPERNHEILRFLFNKVATHRKEKEVSIERPNDINSERILNFVEEQIFFDYKCKGGARFCEIACLSMMKTVAPQVKKYKDCQFGSLNRPCACDKSSKSSGDVELHDNGRLVLSIETKLNVPIDPMIVMKTENKIEKYAPGEYWIISYSKNKNNGSCDLESMCERIHDEYGCRVSILDGIDWLRHLLCILDDPAEFLKEYLDSIEKDEYLMKVHKDKTNELVLKHFGSVDQAL